MQILLLAGISLLVLGGISLSSQRIGLPTLVAYILIGIALQGLLAEYESLDFLAETGIILLFFLLGLKFPLKKLFETARRVLIGGLIDLGINMGATTGVLLLVGVDPVFALFMGGMAYASSSSITLTLLEQRKRMANAEAEFMLALLVFEDLVAPVVVSFLGTLSHNANGNAAPSGAGYLELSLYMILLTAGALALARYGFSRLEDFVAHNIDREYAILFTIGIALTYSGIAIALGLSEVLGAFLAGIMMAETRRTNDLDRIVLPVRNLTLPFFFLHFGSSLPLDGATIPHPGILALVLVISIVGKIVVGILGGRSFGLKPRAALRSGFSLVQRGEFSILIAAMAPTTLRLLGGIYIIITALLGVLSFEKAPQITRAWFDKFQNEQD